MRALALLVTLPLTASLLAWPIASDGPRLAWKFEKGAVLRYRMTTDLEQAISGPVEMTTHATSAQVVAQKVQDVDADGTGALKCTWEALQMRMETPAGETIEYDSTDPASAAPPEPLGGLAKLVGLAFEMRMRSNGEVVALEGLQAALETMVPAGAPGADAMKAMFGTFLDEANLKRAYEVTIWPDKALKVDDTWERDLDLSLGPLGKLKAHYVYTYQGEAEKQGTKCAKVAVKSKTTGGGLQPDFSSIPGAEMLDIALEIGDFDGEGTLYFALERGRLVLSELDTEVEFSMKMTPKGEGEGETAFEMGMQMHMQLETLLLGPDEPAFETPRPKEGATGGK